MLIAVMAFSLSTFVSCNDLKDDMETVAKETEANKIAIEDLQKALEDEISALESELAKANEAIKAAQKAADDAQEYAEGVAETAGDALDKAEEALEKLQDAEANLAWLEANKAALVSALERVQGLDEELKGYVTEGELSETLKDYVTAAELEGKGYATETYVVEYVKEQLTSVNNRLTALEGQLDATNPESAISKINAALGLKADKASLDALQQSVETRLEALETYKTELEKLNLPGLEKKLQDQIDEINTTLEELTTIKADIDNLKNEITDIKKVNDEQKKKINSLLNDMIKLQQRVDYMMRLVENLQDQIDELFARIQSIVYVPDYTDGMITINYGVLAEGVVAIPEDDAVVDYSPFIEATSQVKYKVLPADAAAEIAKIYNTDPSILSYVYESVKERTRAAAEPEFNIVAAEADEKGILTLTVQTLNLGDAFYNNEAHYAIALVAADPEQKYNLSTVYTNVIAAGAEDVFSLELAVSTAGGDDITNLLYKEEYLEGESQPALYKIDYTDLKTAHVVCNGHFPAFKLVNKEGETDGKLYSVAQMEEMGYTVPEITKVVMTTIDNTSLVNTTLTDEQKEALEAVYKNEEVEEYVKVSLAKEDPNAVGLKEIVNYSYSLGSQSVAVDGVVEVTPITATLAFQNVPVKWDYKQDAAQDIKGKDAVYERAGEPLTLDTELTNLPADLTAEKIITAIAKPEDIAIYHNNIKIAGMSARLLLVDEKPVLKLYMKQQNIDNIWDKEYEVKATYLMGSANVELVIPVTTIGRKDVIEVALEPANVDFKANLTINTTTDENTEEVAADALTKIFSDMAGFINGFETADDYLAEIFTTKQATLVSTTINGTSAMTGDNVWKKNGLFIDDKYNALLRYDVNVYDETAKAVIGGKTVLNYELVYKTWFGQEIKITKTLNLTVPAYKFAHFTYRVAQDGNVFYTNADGLYPGTGKESHAVTDFEIAKVELEAAFNIVDADGKDVDVEAAGLVSDFAFAVDPKDEGIEINDNVELPDGRVVNNALSYNGEDDFVLVNGSLYIENENGTRFEVPGAFSNYMSKYQVRKFNPVGVLMAYNQWPYIEVLNPVKYEINVLDYFFLKENRQAFGDAEGKWNHDLIVDGAWVVGNGTNGFAQDVKVTELYGLTINYNNVVVPAEYADVISFKVDDNNAGILTFNNEAQMKLYEDLTVPVKLVVSNTWATQELMINVVFKKNVADAE